MQDERILFRQHTFVVGQTRVTLFLFQRFYTTGKPTTTKHIGFAVCLVHSVVCKSQPQKVLSDNEVSVVRQVLLYCSEVNPSSSSHA